MVNPFADNLNARMCFSRTPVIGTALRRCTQGQARKFNVKHSEICRSGHGNTSKCSSRPLIHENHSQNMANNEASAVKSNKNAYPGPCIVISGDVTGNPRTWDSIKGTESGLANYVVKVSPLRLNSYRSCFPTFTTE